MNIWPPILGGVITFFLSHCRCWPFFHPLFHGGIAAAAEHHLFTPETWLMLSSVYFYPTSSIGRFFNNISVNVLGKVKGALTSINISELYFIGCIVFICLCFAFLFNCSSALFFWQFKLIILHRFSRCITLHLFVLLTMINDQTQFEYLIFNNNDKL